MARKPQRREDAVGVLLPSYPEPLRRGWRCDGGCGADGQRRFPFGVVAVSLMLRGGPGFAGEQRPARAKAHGSGAGRRRRIHDQIRPALLEATTWHGRSWRRVKRAGGVSQLTGCRLEYEEVCVCVCVCVQQRGVIGRHAVSVVWDVRAGNGVCQTEVMMTASDGLSPILVEGDRAKTRRGSQEVDCLWHTTVARDSIVPLHQTISAPLYAFQRQTATESFKFVLCLFDGSRVETTRRRQRCNAGWSAKSPKPPSPTKDGEGEQALPLPCPAHFACLSPSHPNLHWHRGGGGM